MNNFEEVLAHCLDSIQDSKVKEAMLYSLCAGSKRMRPRLLFAILQAYGVNVDKGILCACGIEMIHTYSLIHDDLPCMDDDDLRRGRPTCHKQFGEDIALLAGDGLLTHAFDMAAHATAITSINLELVKEFVKASGVNGMILGQMLDLENEEKEAAFEMCAQIDTLKTGCLFALPLVCGCLIAEKNADLAVWRSIGYKLGLAFQIQDDCLEITSSEEAMGKSLSDEKNQKATFVTLLGYDKAKAYYEQLFDEIHDEMKKCNIHLQPVQAMLDQIQNRNH